MFKETFSIFKNIFQNKKLLLQFSFNDFKAKYAGSALGIVWAFLTPLVTVLTYWFVFSVGLRSRAGDNMPFIQSYTRFKCRGLFLFVVVLLFRFVIISHECVS